MFSQLLAAAALVASVSAIAIPAQNVPGLSKRIDHNGVATFYEQMGGYGSCGLQHQDSDYIIALSNYWMNNQYQSPYCGRTITITNLGGGQQNNGQGRTVTATVADTCPGCDENHLDLSHGAFQALTGGNLDPPGTFNIQWHFNAQ